MHIGIPKEIMHAERRVAATPETVAEYRQAGFAVLVESGAGLGIFASDDAYRAAGAEIVDGPKALYGRSDVVLKVKQPMHNADVGLHEVEMMKPGCVLIAFIHPATPSNHALVRLLRDRNITSYTLDSVPRTLSHAQGMDALTSMSTITGYRSVMLAATYFPRFVPMIGTAVGAIRPASVLILGTGVVGLQAIATAKRLGGQITALDIRREAIEQATTLGAKRASFEVPQELAVGEGGYSRALPEEWLEKERTYLIPLLEKTDIVIASALVPGEEAPVLITEEMVKRMKPGAVIVDVSVDQGGNCAATVAGEVVTVNGVTVCGIANIPGGMPVDATWLFAKNILHAVKHLLPSVSGKALLEDPIAESMLVTHGGTIVHHGTLKAMHLESAGGPASA
ncbi:MAG: NAD(P) transhydrogenase subunit alpha [Gemmatimonadetes bacterium]|nr:NAD(P) transhydrogenase subunit alpha [Gemmatimonadota bacterium]